MAKFEFGQAVDTLKDTDLEEARLLLAQAVGASVFRWASKHKFPQFSVRFLRDFDEWKPPDAFMGRSFITRVEVTVPDLD